jgi:arginase family enzyme
MSLIYIPYHLDEYLPDLNVPLPKHITEFTTDLPDDDVWPRLVALYDAVGEVTEQTIRTESEITVVSGDCTISIGMTIGLQRAGVDPSIVWVDAHGDVQSLETTPSGYLGGMALRVLLGYRSDLMADRLGLRPPDPKDVLLVDGRDLDPAEIDYLNSAGLKRASLDALTPTASRAVRCWSTSTSTSSTRPRSRACATRRRTVRTSIPYSGRRAPSSAPAGSSPSTWLAPGRPAMTTPPASANT